MIGEDNTINGLRINDTDINNVSTCQEKNVTVEQFVSLIWEGYLESQSEYASLDSCIMNGEEAIYKQAPINLNVENMLEYGWDKGWLEEQDILWKERFIERRNAARIIHEFLRIQCSEADEDNWKEAEKLTDLYHCKVCAKHVAQVYLKGIMPAKEVKRFQLLQKIDMSEAEEIVSRMFNREKRIDYYITMQL